MRVNRPDAGATPDRLEPPPDIRLRHAVTTLAHPLRDASAANPDVRHDETAEVHDAPRFRRLTREIEVDPPQEGCFDGDGLPAADEILLHVQSKPRGTDAGCVDIER